MITPAASFDLHSPLDSPGAAPLQAEWLEADELGGFASGTVGGWRTRRYHALLLTATTPPTGHDYHALHRENAAFDSRAAVSAGNVVLHPYAGLPGVSVLTNGSYEAAPEWYRNFLYPQERDRGLEDIEDLAAPGVFSFQLDAGPAVMVLRAGDGVSVRPAAHAERLSVPERRRSEAMPDPAGAVASSYLVDRGAGRTVLAGFTWFTDWGCDSFIALRGLALVSGRLREAEAVLLEWSSTVREGMLANRFPDERGAPEFNAVDASLWYVVAVHDFLEAAPPDVAVRERLGAAVQAILDGYAADTRFAIAADADGLLPALRFFEPLSAHLQTAGLGHVSEVADGDPPHTPGGRPFQAWSVGELIRIQHMVEPPTRASRQEPQP